MSATMTFPGCQHGEHGNRLLGRHDGVVAPVGLIPASGVSYPRSQPLFQKHVDRDSPGEAVSSHDQRAIDAVVRPMARTR